MGLALGVGRSAFRVRRSAFGVRRYFFPFCFCCVIWVFWKGDTGWGVALLVWSILVSAMDNFLRPVLIRRGVELPMILIFVGVVGGLISFGLVGIFVGPIVLAVMYTILAAWIAETVDDAAHGKVTTPAR